MKKLIIAFLFLFCINSVCLSSCNANSFPRDVISSYDLDTIHFLQENGFFENGYGENGRYTSVTVRSEDEIALLNFRKQRTKELEVMHEELKTLKSMLSSCGIRRTQEHLLNIEVAIGIYSKNLIPEREREEKLSSLAFFQRYEGRWQALADDVRVTSNRVFEMNW